jgi:dTDP-4-dehydrorhamnose 3,5-epimerase
MIFSATPLDGAFLVSLDRHPDERGFFARTWCEQEFTTHGLETRLVQCSISVNRRTGTLRGLHFQASPYEEVKLVRCTRGAIFDVIVDLRPDSPTLARYYAVILNADNRDALYVPRGFAHGFQTLEDDTEVLYQMSEFYQPASARGVRWDDPAFGIAWPDVDERIITARDRAYPDFQPPLAGRI